MLRPKMKMKEQKIVVIVYFMSQHFKLMSQYRAKLKDKKFCRDKKNLCRDRIPKQQKMKSCVATKFLCHDIRHSYHDIAKLRRDRIQEESMEICRDRNYRLRQEGRQR